MANAGRDGLPPAVADALATARKATDDLHATDPKRDEFRRSVDGAATALQDKWPPTKGDWPGVPKKSNHLRDTQSNGPFIATRERWYNAMESLHKVGWVAMSSTDRWREHKRRKLEAEQAAHEAAAVSTASIAQSSTQPLNQSMLPLASGARPQPVLRRTRSRARAPTRAV